MSFLPTSTSPCGDSNARPDKPWWETSGAVASPVEKGPVRLGTVDRLSSISRGPRQGGGVIRRDHLGEVLPAIDAPHPDLPARVEGMEEVEHTRLGRQRRLRLDAAPELFVEALDGLRGPQALPLGAREAEEGQEFLPRLRQAARDAGTAALPAGDEAGVGLLRGRPALGLGDLVEVGPQGVQRPLGAVASRLRSLCTTHRCTAAAGQVSPTARRRPAFPSMRQRRGARRPRATRSSTIAFQAAVDSLAMSCRPRSSFSPVSVTPKATRIGVDWTAPSTRTWTAIASRKRYTTGLSSRRSVRQPSKACLSRWTTRLIALLESGAWARSGRSAPRMRRELAPAR